MNIDPNTLIRAYNWAISRGYDPNLEKNVQLPIQQQQQQQIPITSTSGLDIITINSQNSGIYGQMHHSAVPDIQTQISDIKSPPTVFESMLTGTIPCTPIYSDNFCGVIVDANPQAPLHLLIFPKQKEGMERISLITDEVHGSLLGHMIVVAKVN